MQGEEGREGRESGQDIRIALDILKKESNVETGRSDQTL